MVLTRRATLISAGRTFEFRRQLPIGNVEGRCFGSDKDKAFILEHALAPGANDARHSRSERFGCLMSHATRCGSTSLRTGCDTALRVHAAIDPLLLSCC